MSMRKFGVLGIAALAVVTFAGPASTEESLDAARATYNAAGTHAFYVWCTQGVQSFETKVAGSSAEDAQMKAYNAAKDAGKATCWPIWRGKVG
jgi:hypothetical protein